MYSTVHTRTCTVHYYGSAPHQHATYYCACTVLTGIRFLSVPDAPQTALVAYWLCGVTQTAEDSGASYVFAHRDSLPTSRAASGPSAPGSDGVKVSTGRINGTKSRKWNGRRNRCDWIKRRPWDNASENNTESSLCLSWSFMWRCTLFCEDTALASKMPERIKLQANITITRTCTSILYIF